MIKIISVNNLSRASSIPQIDRLRRTNNWNTKAYLVIKQPFWYLDLSDDSFIHDLAILAWRQASQKLFQPLKFSYREQIGIQVFGIQKKLSQFVYFVSKTQFWKE